MSNVSDITEHESRLFLAKVISHGVDTDEISLERVEEMKQEVAEISHKLVTIKADDFSSNFEIKHHVRTGIEMINLGLEHGSQKDVARAARLLNKNHLVKFFQIGNSLKKESHNEILGSEEIFLG
ncbi:MAG: DUF6178 family protein [Candidatus Poribacteria bacterium]|jgi:septum formation topological specificity factor MinE|nr:DUF6178 family protein [Candidatus Poribacteria bacterium]|tara:strand:- start:983 stop:1357 length:375 start_codon:yes stop_codon:yes gene_type:complete